MIRRLKSGAWARNMGSCCSCLLDIAASSSAQSHCQRYTQPQPCPLSAEVLAQLPKKRRQQVFLSLDDLARRELAGLTGKLEAVKSALAVAQHQMHASNGPAG